MHSYRLLLAGCIFAICDVHIVASSGIALQEETIPEVPIPEEQVPEEPNIPHNLIFTYSHNILITEEPSHFYQNIRNTIDVYCRGWDDPNVNVIFLDDDGCKEVIEKAAPSLSVRFENEADGSYKADICRIAALYEYGGYYFDVDIKVVEPVILPPNISFSTAMMWGDDAFFQAFLASAKGYPVLKKSVEIMEYYYEGKVGVVHMGPSTLKMAFNECSEKIMDEVLLLREFNLPDQYGRDTYPGFPHQQGSGANCNWAVENQHERRIYFYSRIPGAGQNCMF